MIENIIRTNTGILHVSIIHNQILAQIKKYRLQQCIAKGKGTS